MAINTLASTQKWVELATSSPTSGSTVTFSSLNEYANYKISYFNCTSSNTQLTVILNNDTGNSYSWISYKDSGTVTSDGLDTAIRLGNLGSGSTNAGSGVITILDANQLIKNITYFHCGVEDANNGQGYWNSQSAINRIDLTLTDAATFSGGTIKVYGRN